MSALERRVMDLGRAVLGGDVVFCADAEHVIDQLIEHADEIQAIEDLEERAAQEQAANEEELRDAEREAEECRTALREVEALLEQIIALEAARGEDEGPSKIRQLAEQALGECAV